MDLLREIGVEKKLSMELRTDYMKRPVNHIWKMYIGGIIYLMLNISFHKYLSIFTFFDTQQVK